MRYHTGLGRAVFRALRASGLSLLLCVRLACDRSFTVCSGWGLLSFLEFFSVFFSILRLFVRHCSSQFFGVFSRNLLVFFVESLEAVCCHRTLLPVVPVCWLVSSVVSSFLSMPTTRPTFNSLSADLFSTPSTSAPPSSGDSGGVSSVASGTSNSLSNEIAVAVAQAVQQSLPSFVAVFRAENLAAPVSSTALPPVSSVVSSVVPGSAMVAASSLSSVAGTLRLPSFVSTFPAISSTPGSCSARLARSISAPIMASHVTSFSSHGESLAASGVKAFVVGPGHAPIPAKLVKKITSGEFVELADLLSTNLRAVDLEPQSFLDGKLLVSRKRRLVEVEDILTWTEAFTIYQMVICASHPHRWSDLTKYKLLIIQTARHAPGRSWLEYDTAFRKDAAATGASDWSRMNLDLYNFHLRSSVPPSSLPSSSGPPPPVATSRGSSARPPYCHSWNRGQCLWPFGDCRFRHSCNSCNGDHPRVRCPFHSPGTIRSRSPSPASGGRSSKGSDALNVSCT